jgi:hypothetical protein
MNLNFLGITNKKKTRLRCLDPRHELQLSDYFRDDGCMCKNVSFYIFTLNAMLRNYGVLHIFFRQKKKLNVIDFVCASLRELHVK